ncbi:MAG: methyl-accepting chemotaxis protein [Clostridia bacterium]|nr:methyl-accepting chemotaxis protein [Clostridia bacterium]
MKISVKFRLILLFLITSIIPITVLGVFAYSQSYQALEKAEKTKLQAAVRGIGEAIQTGIEDTEELLKNLSTTPAYIRLLNDYNTNGMITDQSSFQETNQSLRKIYVQAHGIYENMMIVDRRGKVIIDSWNGSYIGTDISKQEYFRKALAGNGFAISDVGLSDLSQTKVKLPVISMAYPVKEQTGRVAGVIVITYDLSYFTRHLYQYKLDNSGYGLMVDQKGRVLYSPNSKETLKETTSGALQEILVKTAKDVRAYEGIKEEVEEKDTNYTVWYKVVAKPKWLVAVYVPKKEYLGAANRIRSTTLLIIGASTIISMLLGYMIVHRMIKSLHEMVNLTKQVVKGDYTQRSTIHSKDEFGQLADSFNNMVDEQNQVLYRVLGTASGVDSVSSQLNEAVKQLKADMEQISYATQQVSAGADENAAGIEEVSNVTAQIVHEVKTIRDSSEEAVKNSSAAIQTARRGEEAVAKAVQSMKGIESSTQETSRSIRELFESVEHILSFVQVIQSLADQTNLLALNAAIEAARAGEQGYGFAVVANEVKILSEQSNAAAKEIDTIIYKVKKREDKVLQDMTQVIDTVEKGLAAAGWTVESLDKIIGAINENNSTVENILSSIEEQSASIEEISKTINKFREIIRETSLEAGHIAGNTSHQTQVLNGITATANNLAAMAQELYGVVSQFKLQERREKENEENLNCEPYYAADII